ncbi:MAG: DUF1552 domain-containing protein [Bradymonadia bacterium]
MMLNRRAFLRGVGGAALTVPMMGLRQHARAQTAGGPRRLIIMVHPQGTLHDAWTPSGEGRGFELSQILQPLAPHRDRLLVLSQIDNVVRREQRQGNGHNPPGRTLLTAFPFAGSMDNGRVRPEHEQPPNGDAYGPSIDHVIAQRISADTRFQSLHLGIGGDELGEYTMFWEGREGQAVAAGCEGDPVSLFQRLVQAAPAPERGPMTRADRLTAQRGSVLEAVRGNFNLLQSRAGAADRRRLEEHATRIRNLERRLRAPMSAAACTIPGGHTLSPGYRPWNADFDNESAEAHIENLIFAMSCDLTRVGTLQFTRYHGPQFPFIDDLPVRFNGMAGDDDDDYRGESGLWGTWHQMVHLGRETPSARAAMVMVFQWYMAQLNHLLDRLANTPEPTGDGSMLDHTLVLALSELGHGGWHSTRHLPVILAGNAGAGVQMGRHLSLPDRTTGDLYTTLLQTFGGNETHFGLQRGFEGDRLVMGALPL